MKRLHKGGIVAPGLGVMGGKVPDFDTEPTETQNRGIGQGMVRFGATTATLVGEWISQNWDEDSRRHKLLRN